MNRRTRAWQLALCAALPIALPIALPMAARTAGAQAHRADDTRNDAALTRIQATVARPDAMCGDFDQQKSLVGLKRPVQSSGRFCVLKERGVLWNTLKPFTSTLRRSRAENVESQGARVTSRLTASDEPTVAVISDLLFSVLGGDFGRLRSSFSIEASLEASLEASMEASTWRAKLTPRDAGLKRVIGTIELGGGEFVRQLIITEASGDRTIIAFTGFAAGLSALRPEELRAFGTFRK